MFEEIKKTLEGGLDVVLARMEKGREIIDALSADDPRLAEYTKKYDHLKAQAIRLETCISILNEEINVFVEYRDNVIALKGMPPALESTNRLVDEALRLGAVITSVEEDGIITQVEEKK